MSRPDPRRFEARAAARKRVLLVRHGDVSYVKPDGRSAFDAEPSLSPAGREQTRVLAALLRDEPLDIAVHSGMVRARETLELLLAEHAGSVPVEEERGLREIGGGNMNALAADELDRHFTYAFGHAHEHGASFGRGGEPFAAFETRVVAALTRLLVRDDWRQALVVAHGATNIALVGWVLGVGLPAIGALDNDSSSVTILDFDVEDGTVGRRWLRCFNFTPADPTKRRVKLTVLERLAEQIALGSIGRTDKDGPA